MKLLKSALLLGGLCLPTQTLADVTLDLPKGLDIVALNGKNARISKEAVLPNGINQLVVKFTGEFGSSRNNADLFSSDVFVVRFAAQNEKLRFQIPEMKNERHLRAFNKDPDIHIMRKDGGEITAQVAKLEKEGFVFLRDYEQELKEFNRSGSPAVVRFNQDAMTSGERVNSAISASEEMSITAPARAKNRTDDASMAGKMLRYWFEQADEETRREFLESVK